MISLGYYLYNLLTFPKVVVRSVREYFSYVNWGSWSTYRRTFKILLLLAMAAGLATFLVVSPP
ncbi:MAG: hypothetical protein WCO52_04520 [bacterium]